MNVKSIYNYVLNNITKIASIATILALLIACIGLWFQLKTRKLEISCLINYSEILTLKPNDTGLNANYYFKGKKVNHLWKINFQLNNTGDTTIIGEGNKKDILKDFLTLHLADGLTILSFQLVNSNFPCIVSVVDSNKIKIQFDQWKMEETINCIIYVSANSDNLPSQPIITLKRELLNGDIIFNRISNESTFNNRLFNRLPPITQTILIIIGITTNVFFSFSILWFLYHIIKEFIPLKKWEKRYYSIYKDYINKQSHLTNDEVKLYLSFDKNLTDEEWTKIGIPQKPENTFDLDGFYLFGFITIIIFFLTGTIAIILPFLTFI